MKATVSINKGPQVYEISDVLQGEGVYIAENGAKIVTLTISNAKISLFVKEDGELAYVGPTFWKGIKFMRYQLQEVCFVAAK